MKIKILALSIVALIVLSSATTIKQGGSVSEKLIGTWTWTSFINTDTKQELTLEVYTQMLIKEMKTEFRSDNTYIESKLKKGEPGYIIVDGIWKVENEETLSLKSKGDWKPAKIVKFANDSLVLQMAPKINLLLVRKK